MDWYAVTTRPNLEKSATAALQGRGFEAWLPLYRVRRRWSDRVRELELPLFPSYTFCRLDPCRRTPVLATPGTTGIVGFGNLPALIVESEIAAVRKVVAADLSIQPWPFVKIGQRVLVERGPLSGIEGYVLEIKLKQYRLILSITLLQRALSVEIDHDWVKLG